MSGRGALHPLFIRRGSVSRESTNPLVISGVRHFTAWAENPSTHERQGFSGCALQQRCRSLRFQGLGFECGL